MADEQKTRDREYWLHPSRLSLSAIRKRSDERDAELEAGAEMTQEGVDIAYLLGTIDGYERNLNDLATELHALRSK